MARTIVLGTLAAAAGIWWLARAYDVETSAMLGYLGGSAVFVAGAIAVALGGAVGVRALRRRRRRGFLGSRPGGAAGGQLKAGLKADR